MDTEVTDMQYQVYLLLFMSLFELVTRHKTSGHHTISDHWHNDLRGGSQRHTKVGQDPAIVERPEPTDKKTAHSSGTSQQNSRNTPPG